MRDCPACLATIQPEPGFVSWCQFCDWNLEPVPESQPESVYEKAYLRLSQLLGQTLFNQIKNQSLLDSAPVGNALLLARQLSVLVLLTYLVCGLLGLALVIFDWGHWLWKAPGLILIALFVLAWPRRGPHFPSADVIPRSDLPQLYGLVDQITQKFDAPAIEGIILTPDYNASVAQYGYRKRPVLYLGLPLWHMLTPEERLALLGHEIGHLVNHDPIQERWPALALQILHQAGDGICPDSLVHREVYGEVFWAEDAMTMDMARYLMIPVNLAFLAIARCFWALGAILLRLLWVESQRAEYRADLYGLQLAGLDASLSLLEKIESGDLIVDLARRKMSRRVPEQSEKLFAEALQGYLALPPGERERRRRLLKQEKHRIDSTHPATALRIQMLRAQKPHVKWSPLPQRDWRVIADELAPWEQRIAQTYLDQIRDQMYT